MRREIGTPYTLNISLDSTVPNNASAATFAFTIHNEKTDEHIEVGKILTTNPSGTHGIPAGKRVRLRQAPVRRPGADPVARLRSSRRQLHRRLRLRPWLAMW